MKFIKLLLLLLLCSCFETETKKKPVAEVFNYNEMVLVCKQSIWESYIGDTLRKHFSKPIIGLPKIEPKFNWQHYYAIKDNINASRTRNLVEVIESNKIGYQKQFNEKTKQNKYTIYGQNLKQIDSVLKQNLPAIENNICNNEISFFNSKNKKNNKLQKTIFNQFKFFIHIPKTYYLVQQTNNFFWIRKDERSGNNNLLIYTAPYAEIKNRGATITNILNYRNKITKQFIQGKHNDSYMITEQSFYPDFNKIIINNKTVFEIRGLWEFEHDFMKGPYINYAFLDTKNKQFIFLDGFVFNPNKTKRENIFELEAIIKSIVKT